MKNKLLLKLEKVDTTPFGGKALLGMLFFLLFIIPFFPQHLHRLLYNLLFTLVFISAVFSMETAQTRILYYAILAAITEWISYLLDFDIIHSISKIINVVFFIFIVIRLIVQIAKAKEVTADVIVESINGYLLLGLAYSVLIATIEIIEPASFSFGLSLMEVRDTISDFSDYAYYTFVTYSTLGYGDIVPKLPFAKALVVLITISGQLYLTILIAMLVGKFLSSKNK